MVVGMYPYMQTLSFYVGYQLSRCLLQWIAGSPDWNTTTTVAPKARFCGSNCGNTSSRVSSPLVLARAPHSLSLTDELEPVVTRVVSPMPICMPDVNAILCISICPICNLFPCVGWRPKSRSGSKWWRSCRSKSSSCTKIGTPVENSYPPVASPSKGWVGLDCLCLCSVVLPLVPRLPKLSTVFLFAECLSFIPGLAFMVKIQILPKVVNVVVGSDTATSSQSAASSTFWFYSAGGRLTGSWRGS